MESGFWNKNFLFLGVQYVQDQSVKTWVYAFNMSILICMLVNAVLKFYQDQDFEAVGTIASLFVVIIKHSTLFFGSKMIVQILKVREVFWELDVTDKQITFFLDNFKRVDCFHRMLLMVGVVAFAVKPFVMKGTSIFNCYIFPEIPYPIYYVMEFYVLAIMGAAFTSMNVLFCCIITSVGIQFRYLNLKLPTLDFEDVEDDQCLARLTRDLRSIVQYQQFLIRCVDYLNTVLSVPLALLMLSSIFLMCMRTYIVSTNISVVNALQAVLTIFAMVTEFFMVYGLPAQFIMDESIAIAATVYCDCKWYLPKLRPLRKNFLIMMIRSQSGVVIRAGNYHIINNGTIIIMLKTTYSFLAFLQNVT